MSDTELIARLDRLVDEVIDVKVTLAAMEADVRNHIRRTDLAEENMAMLRTEIQPIKRHVAMLEGALKLIGILSVVVGIVAGILAIAQ